MASTVQRLLNESLFLQFLSPGQNISEGHREKDVTGKKEREIEIERKRGGHRVVGERAREGGGGVEER